MRELSLQLKNKKKLIIRQVPENWNELSQKQLLGCVRILLSEVKAPTAKQGELFRTTLLLKELLQVPKPVFFALTGEQLSSLKPLANFLFEDNTLTRQLLPVLQLPWRHGARRYYGPGSSFRNLSFGEFIFADTYFLRYSETQDPEYLHLLLAVLYREKTWFHFIRKRLNSYQGDCRQKFNKNSVEARAAYLQHLPEEIKMAVLTWYRGCRQNIEQGFEHVFSLDKQEEVKKGKEGWLPVLLNLPGEAFGKIDDRENFPVRIVLEKLDQDLADAERIREKQEQQNNLN